MEKKISFGFSKSIKKTTLQPKPKLENNKLQLIDSIEGQSIKIKNEIPTDKGPLVIPLKKNETRLGNNHEQDEKTGNDSTSRSLDEIAAEEILNDLKNAKENKLNSTTFAIPSKKDKTNTDGGKEVTLDDYEDVPISEFGRAMLRGMGWKDEDVKKKTETVFAPRPKGLGLGADKLVKLTAKIAVDEKGEELKLVKGAFVKVVGGRHKDLYGQVTGMDDERGNICVKMAIGREILVLSEFLLMPVPKTEYEKNSKVLNMTKYEEYKNDKKKSSKRADSRSLSRNRSRSVSREKHSSKNKTSDEQYEKVRSKRDNSLEDNESSNYSSRNKDRKHERNFEKRRYQDDNEKQVKHSRNKRSRSRSSSEAEHSSRKKNNEKPSRKNRHSDTEEDDEDRHKKHKEKSHSRSKRSRRRSSTDSEKYSKYKKDRNSTERYKTSEQKNDNDNSNDDRHASRHKHDRSVDRSRKSKYETNHHKHSSKKSKRRSRSRSR